MLRSYIALGMGIVIISSAALGAKRVTPKAASQRIQEFVEAVSPLALSGVEVIKVKPTKSVKEALLAVAWKQKYISEESEFSWVGHSNDAWGADTMSWGETTMKEAYAYVTELDSNFEPENEKEKLKVEANIKKAKAAFKKLLNTGVLFGLAPLGAVQCGVTLAALAIIDPHTGKVYLFAKEGSGC